jgi:thiol:disulfide interchange protein DsbG
MVSLPIPDSERNSMKSCYLAGCLIAGFGFLGAVFAQQAHGQAASSVTTVAGIPDPGTDSPATRVGRFGKIVDARPVGKGGLVAWTVQASNGQQVELYTTADSDVVFTGILWDAKTGQNLSDAFLPSSATVTAVSSAQASVAGSASPSAAPGEHEASAMDGKYTGPIPENIKTVASLDGIQEGKGDPANTVYIIFDPRCHFCHNTYALTRKYVQQGYSIKWIPSLALGDPASGAPVAAAIMQSKTPVDELNQVMTTTYPFSGVTATPTEATMHSLDRNLDFLFAAFKNSHDPNPGVPVAFYIDHRTGRAVMTPGVSSQMVLNVIFGQI